MNNVVSAADANRRFSGVHTNGEERPKRRRDESRQARGKDIAYDSSRVQRPALTLGELFNVLVRKATASKPGAGGCAELAVLLFGFIQFAAIGDVCRDQVALFLGVSGVASSG